MFRNIKITFNSCKYVFKAKYCKLYRHITEYSKLYHYITKKSSNANLMLNCFVKFTMFCISVHNDAIYIKDFLAAFKQTMQLLLIKCKIISQFTF